jgi:hypothetical protein
MKTKLKVYDYDPTITYPNKVFMPNTTTGTGYCSINLSKDTKGKAIVSVGNGTSMDCKDLKVLADFLEKKEKETIKGSIK